MKLQVIEKEITSRSPLRFLRRYADKNLISARSLYPVDDAIGQMFKFSQGISFSHGSKSSLKVEDLECWDPG